ncbi:MAG: glycoside hydrolase family 3 C-terminal domain-containing protein, partial [Ferruginibacter sp.]
SSRTDLTIPPSQKKLIAALVKTGKPLLLVIMSGRPLILNDEMNQATAILQVWHAGTEAGNAIADVIFGNYNPSGKLTMSFPRNVGQIPVYYNHKNTGRPLDAEPFQKFRSAYIDIVNSPLLPFGYGLSYTSFQYGEIKLNKTSMTTSEKIEATVTVKNTGNYDGEEVVQLYIRDMVASISMPVKELKAFQKIFLKKGESKDVKFSITKKDLEFYNADGKIMLEPGEFKIFVGTNSKDVKEARFDLR